MHSQLQTHISLGGIIPPVARALHETNIERVVDEALASAGVCGRDLQAVAVTVKPGLPLSLTVGLEHAKKLCRQWQKPLVPVHHMEAHALTIRMVQQVEFPFLVLLVSGGHCQLAVAKSVDQFLLLGQSADDAPGEVMDKTARRLKLSNMEEFANVSGGRAIETLARRGNVRAYPQVHPMSKYRDCSFSFSGLKQTYLKHILNAEAKHGIEADGIIPEVADVCASFQHAVVSHICRRLQRAIQYVDLVELIPKECRTLVVSGGVACNGYLRDCLRVVCQETGYTLACPPPRLCTDNGVMIAWNGVERWRQGLGVVTVEAVDSVTTAGKCQLGVDVSEDVARHAIRCEWIRLLPKASSSLAQHPSSVLVKARPS